MSGYCHDMLSVVCHVSVVYLSCATRVYCDKTTEVSILRFSHQSISIFNLVRSTAKIEGVSFIEGLKLGWGGFQFIKLHAADKHRERRKH